jgi:hypothetical protein
MKGLCYPRRKVQAISKMLWGCFEEHHPKVVLDLKSSKFTNLDLRNVLLLNIQSTFDLCCNKTFASKIIKAENALSMMSNSGGLKITEKCKIPS